MILLYFDGVHEMDKINISQLKSLFRGNWGFGPNLSQNYAKKISFRGKWVIWNHISQDFLQPLIS